MTYDKDSAEVVKFLTLYTRLKDWCDDDPDAIFQLAISDKPFKDLCREMLWAADRLHANERYNRELFTAPVDPKFLFAWRDFEARYEHFLDTNRTMLLLRDVSHISSDRSKKSTNADRKWEHADLNAQIAADLIKQTIEFASFQASGDDQPFDGGYSMTTEEAVGMAISYWKDLTNEVGLDLANVFRRRMLVPFVFFPRHVAARHDAPEKALIYQSLLQAHDAFIFGVPFAALALMRSTMETVLRDHYNAQGNDLSERINSVRTVLPPDANEAALHRLRKLANAVLHHTAEKDQVLPPELLQIEREMESEIVSLLCVLRALIEGVPQWRHR